MFKLKLFLDHILFNCVSFYYINKTFLFNDNFWFLIRIYFCYFKDYIENFCVILKTSLSILWKYSSVLFVIQINFVILSSVERFYPSETYNKKLKSILNFILYFWTFLDDFGGDIFLLCSLYLCLCN
jgi:hypothetical protein